MKYSEILQFHLQNQITAILYKIQFTYFLMQNYRIQYVNTWNNNRGSGWGIMISE